MLPRCNGRRRHGAPFFCPRRPRLTPRRPKTDANADSKTAKTDSKTAQYGLQDGPRAQGSCYCRHFGPYSRNCISSISGMDSIFILQDVVDGHVPIEAYEMWWKGQDNLVEKEEKEEEKKDKKHGRV